MAFICSLEVGIQVTPLWRGRMSNVQLSLCMWSIISWEIQRSAMRSESQAQSHMAVGWYSSQDMRGTMKSQYHNPNKALCTGAEYNLFHVKLLLCGSKIINYNQTPLPTKHFFCFSSEHPNYVWSIWLPAVLCGHEQVANPSDTVCPDYYHSIGSGSHTLSERDTHPTVQLVRYHPFSHP